MEVKAILLDTNAYAAFMRGDSEAMTVVQRATAIAVNAIVLGELLGGFASGACEEANRRELARFLDSPRVVVLPLDHRTAEQYAVIYSMLKKAASPIPTNDLWIAATAMQHGLAIFTYDRHFQIIQGLQTIASAAELETSLPLPLFPFAATVDGDSSYPRFYPRG